MVKTVPISEVEEAPCPARRGSRTSLSSRASRARPWPSRACIIAKWNDERRARADELDPVAAFEIAVGRRRRLRSHGREPLPRRLVRDRRAGRPLCGVLLRRILRRRGTNQAAAARTSRERAPSMYASKISPVRFCWRKPGPEPCPRKGIGERRPDPGDERRCASTRRRESRTAQRRTIAASLFFAGYALARRCRSAPADDHTERRSDHRRRALSGAGGYRLPAYVARPAARGRRRGSHRRQ